MDLRTERTRRSIINAFIELRAKKPLEKITVKELSELALINKATFYSHYYDIYDLSEQLEREAVDTILKNIPHPDSLITDPKLGAKELAFALTSRNKLFDTLFSGSRSSVLAGRLEHGLKDKIYALHPEFKDNLEWDILLTVLIQGCFYAFKAHSKDTDINRLIEIIGNINERLLGDRQ